MIKINKTLINVKKPLTVIFLMLFSFLYAQDQPPVVTADGNQAFCSGNSIKIVANFNITDADDTTIDSFFIQVSSGYEVGFDKLELISDSNIKAEWAASEGKLILTSKIVGAEMLLIDLKNAIKKIVFNTTSNNRTINRTFSLTFDNANYLPATDHFYEFIPSLGITWENAKIAAENKPLYYGRQGYLATLRSQVEADFAGKQAAGAGWIGGSDAETEGVWKWVTGPESGSSMANFWNGLVGGTTPNFANWSNNEPNDFRGDEDYAHITDPSIGIAGAWNDLPNEGGTNLYIPRGYIVEYGGTPGDPAINIVATTSIYTPIITTTTPATICESETATITATASEGMILWFDALTGGNLLETNNNYTTPILTTDTTYYVTISVNGCTSIKRTPVTVTVNEQPIITSVIGDLICSGTANLNANSSSGDINWYTSLTSTTPIFTGNNYTTPTLSATTKYFVDATISGCSTATRTEVVAEVDSTIPEFEVAKNIYFLCSTENTLTLKTKNALDTYKYVWKKENLIIAGNTPSIEVNEVGNYSVKAVSLSGCESVEQKIIVRNSSIATITNEDIKFAENLNNKSIEVLTTNLGSGNYEFSLDDEFGTYKDIGFFDNLATGKHTLYVKDKNGCGIAPYEFSILAFPEFFTPNGDGKNDVWKIKGYNNNQFSSVHISIYNRFGVLLYQITPSSQGWDGNYQGKKIPSSTYWFRANLDDINGRKIEKLGKFSLIRK